MSETYLQFSYSERLQVVHGYQPKNIDSTITIARMDEILL